ncbi:hypothetical protein [Actinopolymorpha alba]|nr:hypothetical protein [Actinopolymorpha alba]
MRAPGEPVLARTVLGRTVFVTTLFGMALFATPRPRLLAAAPGKTIIS